jgi:hypothetical protein
LYEKRWQLQVRDNPAAPSGQDIFGYQRRLPVNIELLRGITSHSERQKQVLCLSRKGMNANEGYNS